MAKRIMEDNIPGFPGYYVSPEGFVYSNKRGNWVKLKGGIIKGDPSVRLCNKGKHLSQRVYRLVAQVYLTNPKPHLYTHIRHLDDNPLNNHISNLKWGTPKQNVKDAIKNGKRKQSCCSFTRSKLTPQDIFKAFELKKQGLTHKQIGKIIGVSSGTICRLLNHKTYKDEKNNH